MTHLEKQYNLENFIAELDHEELVLYLGDGTDLGESVEKRIILFTHESTRTGAPEVLFNMCKVLKETGYSVFLVALKESNFLAEFVESGIHVIVYENLLKNPQWLQKIAGIFPQILMNTMAFYEQVAFLAPYSHRLYWWIHEAEGEIIQHAEIFKMVPDAPSLTILSASRLIQKNLKEYAKKESEVLNFYIEDVPAQEMETEKKKTRLIHVGNTTYNKGHSLLIEAFETLDAATKSKCELYCCVNQNYGEKDILLKLLDCDKNNENFHLIDGMPRDELYRFYDQMDVMVISSYYESTSAVAVEGMMKQKLCICTNTCGVCEYLKDGESVLTFERGDVASLRKAITKAVNEYDRLSFVRENGRNVYEQVYTKEIFTKRLMDILENQIRINLSMNRCSGCRACLLTCPVGAISMVQNEKGFAYPQINQEKCIHCHKCQQVCPVNSCQLQPAIKGAYAFKRKDKEQLAKSQSGGAFSVLAECVLSEGGVVYGAAFNEQCHVVYERVDNIKNLGCLQGSKYVQADLGNTYQSVREDLKDKKVLFSGTPCYVAGLKKYLGTENIDNLLTCDLICHGVPSPKILESHMKYLENKTGKKVTDFCFRNKKKNGWHTTIETYTDELGYEMEENSYANIFYTDMGLRESCYQCAYAGVKRVSDITIGDFWGIEDVFPDMDDNDGVSLVLPNSCKGQCYFAKIMESTSDEFREVSLEKCMQRNLEMPTPRPSLTDIFWREYQEFPYKTIVRKYGQPALYLKPDKSVLNSWQIKNQTGERISTILKQRGFQKVFVCGSPKYNRVIMMELRLGGIMVCGELWDEGMEVSDKKNTVLMKEVMTQYQGQYDTILVTDENNMAEVLSKLHMAGIPMEQITPLSFILDEEV